MRHGWRLIGVAAAMYGAAVGVVVVDPGDALVSLVVAGSASVILGVAIAEMMHDRKEP